MRRGSTQLEKGGSPVAILFLREEGATSAQITRMGACLLLSLSKENSFPWMTTLSGFLNTVFILPNWTILKYTIKLLFLVIFQIQFYVKYLFSICQNNGINLWYG